MLAENKRIFSSFHIRHWQYIALLSVMMFNASAFAKAQQALPHSTQLAVTPLEQNQINSIKSIPPKLVPKVTNKHIIHYGQIEFGLKVAYNQELLRYVLESTRAEFGDYELNVFSDTQYWTAERYYKSIKEGKVINVSWVTAGDTAVMEQLYGTHIIEIPTLANLAGYRLPIIKTFNRTKFSEIKNIHHLSNFSAGQGHDWAEVTIYEQSGLPVITSIVLDDLFAMLNGERFDYFPLGVLEVKSELHRLKDRYPQLTYDSTPLIYYPLPVYFQVNKKYPEIAKRITQGLENAISSGFLNQLILKHFSEHLKDLKLVERHIIQLPNPRLPASYIDLGPQLIQYLNEKTNEGVLK